MATFSGTRLPATVERQLEALSPRDRRLLLGLVLFFLIVATGGIWYLLHGALESRAARVRDLKEAYANVQQLEAEYREADARFEAQKSRLEQYSKQPVSAWVEDLANRHQLLAALTAVRDGPSEEVGDIRSTRYTIELKKAPQENLYRFLYELETSSFPASVESAAFRTVTVRQEKVMDLTLEIEVLSLPGGV